MDTQIPSPFLPIQTFMFDNFLHRNGKALVILSGILYGLYLYSYHLFAPTIGLYGTIAVFPILLALFVKFKIGVTLGVFNAAITPFQRMSVFEETFGQAVQKVGFGVIILLVLIVLLGKLYNINFDNVQLFLLALQQDIRIHHLEGLFGICNNCKKVKTATNTWVPFETYRESNLLGSKSEIIEFYCPSCQENRGKIEKYLTSTGKLEALKSLGLLE